MAQITKLNAEYREETQKVFGEASEQLFKEIPEIKSFQWTQYTPYFNDGDECTFGVNTDTRGITFINGMKVNLEEIYVSEIKSWDRTTNKPIKRTIAEIQKQIEDIKIEDENSWEEVTLDQLGINYERAKEIRTKLSSFLSAFPEDFMKDTFGDHAIVTLHSDWSSDDEHYEHD